MACAAGSSAASWCRQVRTNIWVPAAALIVRGQMETVFVAANDHAQLRLVRTGKRTDSEVEILAGLSRGEKVITDGAGELRDGQPVTNKP